MFQRAAVHGAHRELAPLGAKVHLLGDSVHHPPEDPVRACRVEEHLLAPAQVELAVVAGVRASLEAPALRGTGPEVGPHETHHPTGRVAPKALEDMKQCVRRSMEQVTAEPGAYLRGWKGYFKLADTPRIWTAGPTAD